MVSEVDARWTMAYAAALGDVMPCYMDTVGGVIAHPLFPVCIEWPVQVAMRAQFERPRRSRAKRRCARCMRRMTRCCIARFGRPSG